MFVTQAAARPMPAIRRWLIAWLDTSTTACEQPLPTIRASQLATVGAEGVVSSAGEDSMPSKYDSVPSKPAR